MLLVSPELLAEVKILQHDFRFALLKQVFGECHVGAKIGPTARLSSYQQAAIGLLDVAGPQGEPAENQIALMNGSCLSRMVYLGPVERQPLKIPQSFNVNQPGVRD